MGDPLGVHRVDETEIINVARHFGKNATDAATALYGAAAGRGWNAPLRRQIKGLV